MIFVSIIGDGYKSDIAVGSVSLTNDVNCTFTPPHAVPGPSCLTPCVGRSKCDNVTGKCVCLDDEFLDEKCQNGKWKFDTVPFPLGILFYQLTPLALFYPRRVTN